MNFKEWLQHEASGARVASIGRVSPKLYKNPNYTGSFGWSPQPGDDINAPLNQKLGNIAQNTFANFYGGVEAGYRKFKQKRGVGGVNVDYGMPGGFDLKKAYQQGTRRFKCPSCGGTIVPPKDYDDNSIECPYCEKEVKIPYSIPSQQTQPQSQQPETWQQFQLDEFRNKNEDFIQQQLNNPNIKKDIIKKCQDALRAENNETAIQALDWNEDPRADNISIWEKENSDLPVLVIRLRNY